MAKATEKTNRQQLTKTEQFVQQQKKKNKTKYKKYNKKHVSSAVKLTFYGLTKLHFSCCQSKKKKQSGNTYDDEARRNLSSLALRGLLMESKTLSSLFKQFSTIIIFGFLFRDRK